MSRNTCIGGCRHFGVDHTTVWERSVILYTWMSGWPCIWHCWAVWPYSSNTHVHSHCNAMQSSVNCLVLKPREEHSLFLMCHSKRICIYLSSACSHSGRRLKEAKTVYYFTFGPGRKGTLLSKDQYDVKYHKLPPHYCLKRWACGGGRALIWKQGSSKNTSFLPSCLLGRKPVPKKSAGGRKEVFFLL